MEKTMTEWYPPHVKPVRVGVYMTNALGGRFQYWNGERWGGYASYERAAVDPQTARLESRFQCVEWRGLTAPAT
ncbi:hypothetical protein CBA19CS22_38035 [Caballeronia novacaledonica]|uniref:Uncharacterized protein n=1 Tax=Caballeronia novacaledonica TaxID=1544861 RepID=A0ACB5R5K5_9BURK|nr:hypothetical protein CBA19CS22_38035 [Caballeronia novacaledonica]